MAGRIIYPLPMRFEAIGATDIGLAQCHLDDDSDISIDAAWQLLSVDEIARAWRFHFDRDRTRYVRGRGFLRSILGQICGLEPTALVFGTGAQGKPFLQNIDLAFNLSHSRDLAILAISGMGPVGIDIEFIDRQVDILGLAQTCLNSTEALVLDTLPEADRAARFFAFWTAKEARMKLTGEGMTLAPRQIALHLLEGHPIGYLRPETPSAQAVFLDLGDPGTICCLALAQGPLPLIKFLSMAGVYDVAV